jgi:hypothetical protein
LLFLYFPGYHRNCYYEQEEFRLLLQDDLESLYNVDQDHDFLDLSI